MALTPIHQLPFFVRQSGLEKTTFATLDDKGKAVTVNGEAQTHVGYGDSRGAIKGYDEQSQAEGDVADRNKRAKEMGVKARYEVVAN